MRCVRCRCRSFPPIIAWVFASMRIVTRRHLLALPVVVSGIWTTDASLSAYRVETASMEPALHCAAAPHCRRLKADIVLVSRLTPRVANVHHGDIVAFTLSRGSPHACQGNGVRLKRVIGLPGDTVRHRNGTVYVNGRRADDEASRRRGFFQRVKVPPSNYFVISDNPGGSCDSRHVGTIPKADVVGKVVLVYSPPLEIRRP